MYADEVFILVPLRLGGFVSFGDLAFPLPSVPPHGERARESL